MVTAGWKGTATLNMKLRLIRPMVLGVLLAGNLYPAWAQNGNAGTGLQTWTQPSQVLIVPPQLTDFERYASIVDQPLVHIAFPAISVNLGPRVSLSLTPRGLTSFNTPGNLKALAVELLLSQSPGRTRGSQVSQSHSVSTLLDFDELSTFRVLFNSLAVTGMPQLPFSEATATVRMTSKSGMRVELTAEQGGRTRCVIATDADSVVLSLDADSARKWADAFTEARRVLDAAWDSRT